jgi:hypothetical protein
VFVADKIGNVATVIADFHLGPKLMNDEAHVMTRNFILNVLCLADGPQLIVNAMSQLNEQLRVTTSHFLTGSE